MKFIGTHQPPKGDSPGYFFTHAAIAGDSLLLRIMAPWITAAATACGAKWDFARMVKSWDFGHRNTRQNTRDKVKNPMQQRRDRIMAHALDKAKDAKTPEEHAETVKTMAVLSGTDEEVKAKHLSLFGQDAVDVPFVRDIGPTPEQIVTHLRAVADVIETLLADQEKEAEKAA